MAETSVFQFTDFRAYLNTAMARTTKTGRRLSLDEIADRLGYRSARSVAMVLKGQRLPSAEMALRFGKDLRLSHQEQLYFNLLIALAKNKQSGKSIDSVSKQLEKLNPKIAGQVFVDPTVFSYVARWYHFVIKQLIATPGFQEDAEWIRQKLRRKVRLSEVREAIAVLEKLGFVERTAAGKLTAVKKHTATTTDIPSTAIRSHHRQMLARAADALEEQSVHEREMTSVTLQFEASDLPEAKKRIREFRDAFNKDFSSSNAQGVWQINIQFFEHTKRGKRETAN